MKNALFVCINETYDELTKEAQENPLSSALRNCTTNAWHVSVENAKDVEWILGIVRTKVVSVYRVPCPSSMWPTIPDGAIGAGRKIVPTEPGEPSRFTQAMAFGAVQLSGPVGYGEISVDPNGQLIAKNLP
jgi:hypothetical protein